MESECERNDVFMFSDEHLGEMSGLERGRDTIQVLCGCICQSFRDAPRRITVFALATLRSAVNVLLAVRKGLREVSVFGWIQYYSCCGEDYDKDDTKFGGRGVLKQSSFSILTITMKIRNRCIKSIGKVTKKIEEDLDDNNDLDLGRGFIEKANLTIISEFCSRELHDVAISQLNFFYAY